MISSQYPQLYLGNGSKISPTLHASLDNVQRMDYQGSDSASTEASNGLDKGGGAARMAVLGHKETGDA